jgi:hypothetical protein
MIVDGINFRIPKKVVAAKGNAFASHKYNSKPALHYKKLGVSILGGDLVWIQGLNLAGKYTKIKIFHKFLCHFLNPGKLIKANDGYVGHVEKEKYLKNMANPVQNRAMQSRVMVRHKTLNRWLKNRRILSQTFATTSLCMVMCSGHARW